MEGLTISEVSSKALEFSGRIDAEYYRPEMLRYEAAVKQQLAVKLGDEANFLIGPFGSSFTVENYTDDSSYRYIRGKDVKPLTLMENDNVYMPEADFTRLKRYALRENDILVSVVGTLGNSAIVTKAVGPAVFSCKSTVVRPKSLNPKYLTVYLNCEYGYKLLVRKERGVIQTGLNLDDLKDMPVFRPSSAFQSRVAQAFDDALNLADLAKQKQAEAETALLAALGLAGWTPPEPLTYTARAADALTAARLDAQYFMPSKLQMIDALAALPGEVLGVRFKSVRDMFDPAKADPDLLVRNFDLPDALETILDDEKKVVACEDVGSLKKTMQNGDVAMSRLRAYLKETAVVRTGYDYPAVGSSEFLVLRPINLKTNRFAPETLMIFLRSPPVQTILKWCQDGSQHPRFSERDLLAIPLPDAVADASEAIEAMVQSAFAARARSRALLSAAKRAVEIAIEDGEAAALAWLEGLPSA